MVERNIDVIDARGSSPLPPTRNELNGFLEVRMRAGFSFAMVGLAKGLGYLYLSCKSFFYFLHDCA